MADFFIGDYVKGVLPDGNVEGMVKDMTYKIIGDSVVDGNQIYACKSVLTGDVVYTMGGFVREYTSSTPKYVVDKFDEVLETVDTDELAPSKEEDMVNKFDVVEKPAHYANRSIEVISYVKDNMTEEMYKGYLEGNVLKYISRYKSKNGLEDLKKARYYLERLIELS